MTNEGKYCKPVVLLLLITLCICLVMLLGLYLQLQGQKAMWLEAPTLSGGVLDTGVVVSDDVVVVSDDVVDGECDLYDGKWVWDETNHPLYVSKDCNFMDGGFRCAENGRMDDSYTKWRWQPNACNLPRFDAKLMLERLRNKRLVYVGDSIGRNQWESMLCMLASAVHNKSSIYEMNGNPITKRMGFLIFMFQDYNCTVEYFRAPFIVQQGRAPKKVPKNVTIRETLKLDKLPWTTEKWKDADFLVFNSGHWWTHDKTIRKKCYFQLRDKVMLSMSVEAAFRRSIETLGRWANAHVNKNKTRVFFRSYAPVHYRGGDWKNGGTCRLETMPNFSLPVPAGGWPQLDIIKEALIKTSSLDMFDLVNVTYMTHQRIDAHSSIYNGAFPPKFAPSHRQDCSHWCLPGVPDTWNELIYSLALGPNPTKASLLAT